MVQFSKNIKHIASCSHPQGPCPSKRSLHGEKFIEHWWSGWPGAFCMKCGTEDVMETCLADSCYCPCHEDFWQESVPSNS